MPRKFFSVIEIFVIISKKCEVRNGITVVADDDIININKNESRMITLHIGEARAVVGNILHPEEVMKTWQTIDERLTLVGTRFIKTTNMCLPFQENLVVSSYRLLHENHYATMHYGHPITLYSQL